MLKDWNAKLFKGFWEQELTKGPKNGDLFMSLCVHDAEMTRLYSVMIF